jgi:NAD-dependent dihydropyrimidine dehydrogenase PreA subunit
MQLRYLKNVTTLKLDSEKCNGCGICMEVCPHPVFILVDKKVEIFDRDACIECGACALNCPTDALEVRAGVGCATAVLTGIIRGTEPTCGCECSEEGEAISACCG